VKLNTHLLILTVLRMGGVLPALRGSSTGDFERWMKGSLGVEPFSLKRLCVEGLWGGAPLLGTLEDMLRKPLDTGISLHRGPFPSEGNLESGGGARVMGTLDDE
jgi:hypothetical protein